MVFVVLPEEMLRSLFESIFAFLPRLAFALIALLVGWVLGKLIGATVGTFVRKLGVDDAFKNSALGKALTRFGMSISSFLGASIKWFVYAFAVMVSIDLLGIPVLERFAEIAIEYLPNLVGGLLILVAGMLLSEIFVQILDETLMSLNIPYVRLIALFSRLILYSVVLATSLLVMKIDVTIFYSMFNALFWGIALGIGLSVGIALGFGLKDQMSKAVAKWFETVEKAEKSLAEREYEERIKKYSERIKELEEELEKEKKTVEELKAKKREDFKVYEKLETDLDERLRTLMKNTGTVKYAYGRYTIEVKEPSLFPWTEILVTLSSNGFEVTLRKVDEKYVLEAELMRK